MDRISGLMPQVGWSPLLAVSAPKKAPATTVEPAANAANTNGGMGADVNAQENPAKVVQLQARANDLAMETAVLAQTRAAEAPDPDAPTGPPPTFDVTPLEAQAAELRAVPRGGGTAAPEEAAEPKPEAAAETEAPQEAAEEPAATSATPGNWHASDAAPEPSVDVTR